MPHAMLIGSLLDRALSTITPTVFIFYFDSSFFTVSTLGEYILLHILYLCNSLAISIEGAVK